MKTTFACIMSVIVLFFLAASTATGEVAMLTRGDSLFDAELICSLSFGEKDDELGYKESDAFNEGPESFAILNDEIYILDSVKKRIVIKNEESIRYIDLTSCQYPSHLCVSCDSIFVLDYLSKDILVMSKLGESQAPISLPSGVECEDVKKIIFADGNLQLSTFCNDFYIYDGDWHLLFNAEINGDFTEKKALTINKHTIVFSTGENTSAELLCVFEHSIYVGVYEFVPYIPIIESEYTIRRYSLNGELLGCSVFDTVPAVSIPQDRVFFNDSGEVYIMQCRSDGVFITKPHLRMEYYSHMNELAERAAAIWELISESQTRTASSITTLTRSQVLSRASSAANLYWTITSDDNNPPANATKPHYIKSSTVGTTIKGIPYCWGRYLSSTTKFSSQHNSSYTAGNICKTNGYVSGTTGLDCSGFVSYAYLLGSHHDTSELYNEGFYVNGNNGDNLYECSLANMKDMDFMLRYNQSNPNHVVLFHGFSAGSFTIYDSTTAGNADKVSKRHPTASNMNDYYVKTPYACGGTSSCLYTNDYEYNSLHHWKVCHHHCGSTYGYYTHLWMDDPNGGFFCRTCGYHVDVIPSYAAPVLKILVNQ